MCGIIGILSQENVVPRLIEGLRRLEYRGYDSAGIAVINNEIDRRRAEGKLVNLEKLLEKTPLSGTIGIGHTRWATHGMPNEANAHPHANDKVAVVHNGIIENFAELRTQLEAKKHIFKSDTDTEVIVHLMTAFLDQGLTNEDAFKKTIAELKGAFALVVLTSSDKEKMFCARKGSPLAIGYGESEMFIGSDALALAPLTQKLTYLEEGDIAIVEQNHVHIFDADSNTVERPIKKTSFSGAMIGKGNYRHFMQKEIFEQPVVLGDTFHTFFNTHDKCIAMPDLKLNLTNIPKVTILACGTSFYAGMVAKYWLEQVAEIPTEVDIASEFRYRAPKMPKDGLVICISQSGETADTLAALRYAKTQNQKVLSIVNVAESTMTREADAHLLTLAGPEIGVASTKAFTTQLMTLACLTVHLASINKTITQEKSDELTQALAEVPALSVQVLEKDAQILALAKKRLEHVKGALYLGRGSNYPIAMEGALKLKELAYTHAEGYAAGEMKHGPIALIDENLPVIVISPTGMLFEKMISNLQEVKARGGQIILLSDSHGLEIAGKDPNISTLEMPHVHSFVAPILYALPVQMLAYHTAALKGTDVDQPRNLAKSVTVE